MFLGPLPLDSRQLFLPHGPGWPIYEVCWIRKASLAFGSATWAVSAVLAVFFAGLALGSFVVGLYSPRVTRPLRVYAWLESGVGLAAREPGAVRADRQVLRNVLSACPALAPAVDAYTARYGDGRSASRHDMMGGSLPYSVVNTCSAIAALPEGSGCSMPEHFGRSSRKCRVRILVDSAHWCRPLDLSGGRGQPSCQLTRFQFPTVRHWRPSPPRAKARAPSETPIHPRLSRPRRSLLPGCFLEWASWPWPTKSSGQGICRCGCPIRFTRTP